VLRPKANGSLAHFYTLITRDTKEQEFGMNRQLFLIEQGYSYDVREWKDLLVEETEARQAAEAVEAPVESEKAG
jgi:hypothetical protein